ncbi:MAG TPA: hypothetical protein PKZ08_01035 [Vicinamibacterales bacterium]|nr:hypothetical protein [Vicinamibacterales bacterium]
MRASKEAGAARQAPARIESEKHPDELPRCRCHRSSCAAPRVRLPACPRAATPIPERRRIFTDYLWLYESPDGWEIVGKIYHRH